jgi:putative transposase
MSVGSSGAAKRASTSGKKRYGNLGLSEVKELRQLRDENTRLKRLVADLTLDKHILAEVVRKKL